ncbi:MAG: glycosyltransferase family 39 protein [Candidatus Curtissbacteria bacterium]|nr:glycosyltransferase family 39 protein [Candidatus Curtissbacteria bacterium]
MRKYLLLGIILLAATLRLYKLASVPPSLYWDEASLGYNAYSILKTAHDEHGKFLPLTNFAAFGDYKPPGYIYAAVPSIAVFGLTEFAIRFPSAFFGTLTVLLTYLLAKKLFEKEKIALLSAFFLAISPWHLQFSRGAFEANLGLFLSVLGIYLFVKFAKDNQYWILLSLLSFLAAMYTFTGQRLFVPFILLILFIQFKNAVVKNLKVVIPGIIIFAFLFWPLYKFATGTIEGRLRFNEVSIFNDLAPADESTRLRTKDNFAWWANLIHNRRLEYAHEYLVHYFDAFNPAFLFTKGDVNPRLSVQEVGELYLIDLPLILSGIYFLFAKKQNFRFLIIAWLLVSPLGPATARETPHALRMIHILPTFQLLAAFGFFGLWEMIKYKKVFAVSVFLLLAASFIYYLNMYYIHWPINYSGEWQYGYKQAVQTANLQKSANVVVTKSLGRPYIYFLLYSKYDPGEFWATGQVVRDKFFFLDVNGFGKYHFVDDVNQAKVSGETVYVSPPGSVPKGAQVIDTILNLDGSPTLVISKKNVPNPPDNKN